MAVTYKPATAKQTEFALALYTKFYGDAVGTDRYIATVGTAPSTGQVSAAIDQIKMLLAAKSATATTKVPCGLHATDQVVYRVRENKAGTSRYAERLTTAHDREIDPTLPKWVYEGRAPLARLGEATVLTLDQAKAHGTGYGVCVVCGALLEDPQSVAAGIGPVCAAKF